MSQNGKKPINNVSNEFKFNLVLVFCIMIHSALIVFSKVFDILPLLIFNTISVSAYVIALFLVKNHKKFICYFSFFEIIVHGFFVNYLVGNKFGFTMYFILITPLAYNLLYSISEKNPIIKATFCSILCFILYLVCYYISEYRQPVYSSPELDKIAGYIYIVNIFLTFLALIVFSVLFLLETDAAFGSLNNKNKELGELANTDPLTGLFNRRTMTEEVKRYYEDYKDNKNPFSLIICDIDDFKKFNDTYGHECGDEVVKTIAKKLSSLTRDRDYLCRWGGEEFLILLNHIEQEKAKEIAERFRSNIADTEIVYEGKKLHITMTFGEACVTEAETYNDLFRIADERLYEGKNKGKNCVV